jgi:pyruvate kinase
MTKILATIGPASEGKNLKYIVKKSDFVRLNMSHNSIMWHNKNINQIKKIDPGKLILVDIPGIKPRTLNEKSILIKKGQTIKFGNNNQSKNIIRLSNPIPKINKNTKFFSLSDGIYQFKFISLKKNILTGKSLHNFTLISKKGLNLPFSIYNNILQEKKYFSFLKKIKKLKFDYIGLSFIQNAKIINTLKKKYPRKLFISKIENYLGYKNRKEIIQNSDAIMIDRGDLAAEVGITKLSEYVENIIDDAKNYGKPIIIATENLNSLIHENSPSKSDVTNIDYYVSKKVDYLMLSDETATSKNWRNTIWWISEYLKKIRKKKVPCSEPLSIEEIIKNLKDQTLVIFSKMGYFYKKIAAFGFKSLIIFTEDDLLAKRLKLHNNCTAINVKFPKKYLHEFLYNNIKKNKSIIFKNNNFAYLTNVIFPRKKSRANSLSIINKNDFSNLYKKN